MVPVGTVSSIVDELVRRLDPDALADLASEDITAAVETHFEPVRLRELPQILEDASTQCSTDGYYDTNIDPNRPWIFYASAGNVRRTRFTIVHEVGHHLIATTASDLLDAIDELADQGGGAQLVEERVCHGFAGRILVPDHVLKEVTHVSSQLTPQQIEDLHAATQASYEACIIRAVEMSREPVAVALLRKKGRIGFSASSAQLPGGWWPRGGLVKPGGPLDRCFEGDRQSRKDQYRFGLAFEEQMFCDTKVLRPGELAVAVMSRTRSDGVWDLLEPQEPSWKSAEQYCEWDGEEMDVGWCDLCKCRRCRNCDRCACEKPRHMRLCDGCGLPEPPNPGHRFCRSCVLDGRED